MMNFSQTLNLAKSAAPTNIVLYSTNQTYDLMIFKSYVPLDVTKPTQEVAFTIYPGIRKITMRMSAELADAGWLITDEISQWLSFVNKLLTLP